MVLILAIPGVASAPSSPPTSFLRSEGWVILAGACVHMLVNLLKYTNKLNVSEMARIANQPDGLRRHRLLSKDSKMHDYILAAVATFLRTVGIEEHDANPIGPSIIITVPGATIQNEHSDLDKGWSIILAITDRYFHLAKLLQPIFLAAGDVLIFDAKLCHYGAALAPTATASIAGHAFAGHNLTHAIIKAASRACIAPPPTPLPPPLPPPPPPPPPLPPSTIATPIATPTLEQGGVIQQCPQVDDSPSAVSSKVVGTGLLGVEKVSLSGSHMGLSYRARVPDGRYDSGALKKRTIGYYSSASEAAQARADHLAAQAHADSADHLASDTEATARPAYYDGVRLFLASDPRSLSGYQGVAMKNFDGHIRYQVRINNKSAGFHSDRLSAAADYARRVMDLPTDERPAVVNSLIATWAAGTTAPAPGTCSDTLPTVSGPPLGFALTEVALAGSAYLAPAASASGAAALRRFSVGNVVSISHRLLTDGEWVRGRVSLAPRSMRKGASIRLVTGSTVVLNPTWSLALPVSL